MNNFEELSNLPVYDLQDELKTLFQHKIKDWGKAKQICLNSTEENSNDIYFGAGSLQYDWNNSYTIVNENKEEKIIVPERKEKISSFDFKYLCNQFKNTLFEDVYNNLTKQYKIGRVRLMKSESKTCLSWHTDSSLRIHYPIKTQIGCFMIIDDEVQHLKQNTWYLTKTTSYHTAINSSLESRIHLVAEVF